MPQLSGTEDDLRLYRQLKPELVPQFLGQYVLIRDGALVGTYPSYQAALDAATAQFGAVTGGEYLYTIKEVQDPEPVENI